MNTRILAALLAAAALPVAAQVSTARTEPSPAPVQAKSAKAKPDGATPTPRDRARLAKAQNKQARRPAREKRAPPKKASAT